MSPIPASVADDIPSEVAALAAYFFVGCGTLGVLEGWSPLQSAYFLTVSITTVGYGDIVPVTDAGKLFTSAYILVGIFGAFNILASLLASGPLLRARGWQEGAVEGVGELLGLRWLTRKVDTLDRSLSLQEVNASINYTRRYLLSLLGPLVIFVGGVVLSHSLGGFESLSDSVYWAVATMTTVGFGDLTPAASGVPQPWGELLAILYIPIAVIVLADAVAEVARITLRRQLRESDLAGRLGEYLCTEAAELRDPSKPLSEAEFLIAVLIERDVVDSQTLMAVRRQYRELSRLGAADDTEVHHELSADAWFRILRQRGELPPDVTTLAATPDGGFGLWYERYWVPSVEARIDTL